MQNLNFGPLWVKILLFRKQSFFQLHSFHAVGHCNSGIQSAHLVNLAPFVIKENRILHFYRNMVPQLYGPTKATQKPFLLKPVRSPLLSSLTRHSKGIGGLATSEPEIPALRETPILITWNSKSYLQPINYTCVCFLTLLCIAFLSSMILFTNFEVILE